MSVWLSNGQRCTACEESGGAEQIDGRVAVHVSQSKVTTCITPCQPGVIQSEGVQNCGMQVMHVHGLFHGMESEVISGSPRQSTANSATGHPDTEGSRMMISAITIFNCGRPPELGAPDDKCFIQQSALFQILQQGCNRPIDSRTFPAKSCIILCVVIPGVVGGGLDIPHPLFRQFACQQALSSEVVGGFITDAIHGQGSGSFIFQSEQTGQRGLHAESQFVAGDQSFDSWVCCGRLQMTVVQRLQQIQLSSLQRSGNSIIAEVGDAGFGNRNLGCSDGRGLVFCRQERGSVVLYSAMSSRWGNGNESGQVCGFSSKSVADPGSDTGAQKCGAAGVQIEQGFTMSGSVRVHGADHTHAIRMPGQLREQFADFHAAVSAATEFEG